MLKARLMLVAFAFGCAAVSTLLYHTVPNAIWAVVSALLFFPVLAALLLTFLSYEKTADGLLVVDQNQLLYRILYWPAKKGLYIKPQTLCGTTWKAGFTLGLTVLAGLLMFLIGWLLYSLLNNFGAEILASIWNTLLAVWGWLVLGTVLLYVFARLSRTAWARLPPVWKSQARVANKSAKRIFIVTFISAYFLSLATPFLIDLYAIEGLTLWQIFLRVPIFSGILVASALALVTVIGGIILALEKLGNVPFVQEAKQALCPRVVSK